MSVRPEALRRTIHAKDRHPVLKAPHLVQVLSVKQIDPPPGAHAGQKRCCIVVSNNMHCVQTLLVAQHHGLVWNGSIARYASIRISKYRVQFVGDKRFVISNMPPQLRLNIHLQTHRHLRLGSVQEED